MELSRPKLKKILKFHEGTCKARNQMQKSTLKKFLIFY